MIRKIGRRWWFIRGKRMIGNKPGAIACIALLAGCGCFAGHDVTVGQVRDEAALARRYVDACFYLTGGGSYAKRRSDVLIHKQWRGQ
jgi:hypothetical protein